MGVGGEEHKPLDPTDMVGKGATAPPTWFTGLRSEFGTNFLVMLFCVQHLTKGFVKWLTDSGQQFVFREYGLSASQMAVYRGVVTVPWASKPVFGIISDYFPIAGYARGPYMVLTTILCVAALSTLGFMQSKLPVVATVMLLACVAFHISFSDLLTEAVYAKKIREHPALGPDLIAFVWGGLFIMGSIGTAISGTIIENSSVWMLYLVALAPAAITIVPTAANYLGETRMSQEQIVYQRRNVMAQVECVFLCGVMLVATCVLTVTGIFVTDKAIVATISCVIGLVVLACFSIFLNPVIAKVNAFSMIQTILALRYQSAAFFFFTDDEQRYPDGPHFSTNFVATVLPLVGSVFGFIGIIIYKKYMQDLTYTYIYIVMNCIAFVAYTTDTVFYLRWNRAVGIPDMAFAVGSTALEEVIHSFLWMPACVIMSHLCPKGLEAIMFALLASCHNLGAIISTNLGAYVLEVVGCNPTGDLTDAEGHAINDSKALSNLWIVSVLATVLPMFTICLVPWFIPARKQNENLHDEGDGDVPATEGSLYQRWFGITVDADPEERAPLRRHQHVA